MRTEKEIQGVYRCGEYLMRHCEQPAEVQRIGEEIHVLASLFTQVSTLSHSRNFTMSTRINCWCSKHPFSSKSEIDIWLELFL